MDNTHAHTQVSKIRSFTDLEAWKEGHKLVLMTYDLIKKFPPEERFGLADQLRRAVVSVTSNIAEGFGRKSAKEKKQFFTTALTSLTEAQNQFLIAKDVRHITLEDFRPPAEKTVHVSKLINGLMKTAKDRS